MTSSKNIKYGIVVAVLVALVIGIFSMSNVFKNIVENIVENIFENVSKATDDGKRARTTLVWMTHSAIQVVPSLILNKWGIPYVTLVLVYQAVWTNVFEHILSHVFVSDKGFALLQEHWPDSFESAFGSLVGKSFQRSLMLILVDICILSILLEQLQPAALPLLEKKLHTLFGEPNSKLISDIIITTALGSAIQLTYGATLRGFWVHGTPSAEEDGIMALVTILTTLLYAYQYQAKPSEEILESKNGRRVLVVLALLASFVMASIPSDVSNSIGGTIFFTVITFVCIVALIWSKRAHSASKVHA